MEFLLNKKIRVTWATLRAAFAGADPFSIERQGYFRMLLDNLPDTFKDEPPEPKIMTTAISLLPPALFKLLVEKGANPKMETPFGNCLTVAALKGSLENIGTLEYLLDLGLDKNSVGRNSKGEEAPASTIV